MKKTIANRTGLIPYTLVKSVSHKRVAAKGIGRRDYYIGIAVIAILVILAYGSTIQSNGQSVLNGQGLAASSTTSRSSSGSNLCSSGLPIQFTVLNALTGSAVSSPTLNIYQGQLIAESPSVSSGGIGTTGGSYNTGSNLVLKLSGASTITEFLPFTVPPITCGSNQSNNVVKVYTIAAGAWTITAAGQGGTIFTSGQQYYLSQLPAGDSGTNIITMTFSETSANSGYHTSIDIVNSLVQNMVVQFKDTSTSLSVSGLPRLQIVGTTRYWLVNCGDGITGTGYSTGSGGAYQAVAAGDSLGQATTNPATGTALLYPSTGPDAVCQGGLTQQTIGVVTTGGTATISFGVSQGSLAVGTNEAIAVSMNEYSSISYFNAQTSLGPNSAAVGNPQGSSAGTAFTLDFMP